MHFDVSVNALVVHQRDYILPYHQLMTPQWIQEHATISGPYQVFPHYFEILNTIGAWYLQVQLVPPGVLKANDSVTVTMKVAMDTELANSRDHDVEHGVSDNTSFLGFIQFNNPFDLRGHHVAA